MSQRVDAWIDGYRTAWESNDPADIRRLFTEEATYLTAPFRDPWRGQEAIVQGWLTARDEEGATDFSWELLGEAGPRAFVQGTTDYRGAETYSNLWVIDFADDGRADAFTEWWMRQDA